MGVLTCCMMSLRNGCIEFDPGTVGKGILTCYTTSLIAQWLYRVWSRNGREGYSDMLHYVIAQWLYRVWSRNGREGYSDMLHYVIAQTVDRSIARLFWLISCKKAFTSFRRVMSQPIKWHTQQKSLWTIVRFLCELKLGGRNKKRTKDGRRRRKCWSCCWTISFQYHNFISLPRLP